ncbi:DNA polymerase III subunit delta' [Acidipropionibacterium jensenii]|uniref:DNA polymerase III subunit delta n=2 Tax=Acidipropionibacterium jensenii TaxID=1749 RepID=A0A3T0RX10_9ACTN|nr:DNA polymerase III subunit delta' [Acidipropionibacterium jensenii]AZZ38676.1 DNA polymerase III subunit delta' [Acidipropionibacterium jensenii]MDN5977023.1 DNA polymerase III subunit delta' [Acidipropionibacterium jensenii]MDN5995633.1 DNA polymerase III subunit delta' [Acidipropionibacterium jensenii]MDN6021478.1 DNA polymerase III subunit delta' [Acidipropionibacterium jensenii]MDN6426101.1 DNA polymerase III subunit delta' [Acidipropionibacterium jensenii]
MSTTSGEAMTGVWSDLVGQESAVATLRRAVEQGGHAMSHAWLLTGPPGSGRSNAARAFAAALECPENGCGHCNACRTALSGAHPDVSLVRTETLSIGVDEVRDLVRRAAMSPSTGRYQVVVVEDADRITERGADALLKAIEEPAPLTVWMLCAPTPDDVIITIRSRCRQLHLATPRDEAVAQLLVSRDKVPPELAATVARAAQGHIGRARRLGLDENARRRRDEILALPTRLRGLGDCLRAAQELVTQAGEEAAAATAEQDTRERTELERALGFGTHGARPRHAAAALKDLEDEQKLRVKRMQRDALDRVLTELTTFHRDVLALQTGAVRRGEEDRLTGTRLVNSAITGQLHQVASSSTPDDTIRRIDAILEARTALETNVAPLLAMEALLTSMVAPAG